MNSQTKRIVYSLFKRKVVIVSLGIIVVFALFALFSPLFAPYDPYAQDLTKILAPVSAQHWLGTDEYGRDLLSRIIYGSRIAFIVGVLSALLAAVVGVLIGLVSGYFMGAIDAVLQRIMEAMMSVPSIILAMALVAVFGNDLIFLSIILGVSMVPTFARMMRGQVMVVRELDYVEASRLCGNGGIKTMLCHILPNCISPILVLISQNIGIAILTEASLSYLGVGVTPPTASWGQMVSAGYSYLTSNPVFALAPGCAIVILVLAFNIFGDGLRDAIDPRLNG
ncbi:MAG: ABC transporter permease [Hungatella hathewayi]|nr:ABC transporter permease [Hungatella hathewayi]